MIVPDAGIDIGRELLGMWLPHCAIGTHVDHHRGIIRPIEEQRPGADALILPSNREQSPGSRFAERLSHKVNNWGVTGVVMV